MTEFERPLLRSQAAYAEPPTTAARPLTEFDAVRVARSDDYGVWCAATRKARRLAGVVRRHSARSARWCIAKRAARASPCGRRRIPRNRTPVVVETFKYVAR